MAGESTDQPPVQAALAALDRAQPQTVYARALRTMVYARLPSPQYAARLAAEVAWLVQQQGANGGWGYGPTHPITLQNRTWTDNSNSQLALVALRDASEAGAAVPQVVWQKARFYWRRGQNADGGWGYDPPGLSPGTVRIRPNSYGAMSAAGAASLFILADKSAEAQVPPASRPLATEPATRTAASPEQSDLEKAGKWLADNYSVQKMPKWVWGESWLYYYHYCLARTADTGGWRTIGEHDWYAEMAGTLLARQLKDGSWPDPEGGAADNADDRKDAPIRTSLALMALLEGGKGLLIHKLEVPETHDVDPRDAAVVTRWLSSALKRPLTWQRLPPSAAKQQLCEAPILYLHADAKMVLTEGLSGTIRDFVLQGGTVLVQSDAADPDLGDRLQGYFLKLLPEYRAARLSGDHPVYDLRYKIPPAGRPECIGVGDYFRTRVFIVTSDLSGAWHRGAHETGAHAFHFAANLALYATDTALPTGRLPSTRRPRKGAEPRRWLALARVKHAGDWDTCPLATPRLGEVLAAAVSVGLRETDPQDLSKDVPPDVPLLWMTGSVPPNLGQAERQRLKGYLTSGGMLFVDSAAGRKEFADAAAATLREMFGPDSLQPLDANAPLLTGAFGGGIGSDVRKVAYNRAVAADQPAPEGPELSCVQINGRIAVIFSPYGVTCPAEGNPTYGCLGLSVNDARRLGANVVLYAALRRSAADDSKR